MKHQFWTGCLLLLSIHAFAQSPQNAPSMPATNTDEMTDYQNPLPNEGNGTSTWSDKQAQEERNFNKNRDFESEERAADFDEENYENEAVDPDAEEEIDLD